MLMGRHLETVSIVRLAHGLEPLRHPLGVTMLASGADFGASGNRIPRRFCPFDCRFVFIALIRMIKLLVWIPGCPLFPIRFDRFNNYVSFIFLSLKCERLMFVEIGRLIFNEPLNLLSSDFS